MCIGTVIFRWILGHSTETIFVKQFLIFSCLKDKISKTLSQMELTLPLLNSSQLQLAPDLCTFVQKAFLLLFIQKESLSSRNLSEAYWNENDLGHIRYTCGFYYLLKILCTTKYVLISMILNGRVVPLPSYRAAMIPRTVKRLCADYTAIETLCQNKESGTDIADAVLRH
uniref:SOCS box domain-containing protein n=1 Tax=Ascaris lumbricoides TaxID=6252 RepID=A0A0M3IWW0_ASCLU